MLIKAMLADDMFAIIATWLIAQDLIACITSGQQATVLLTVSCLAAVCAKETAGLEACECVLHLLQLSVTWPAVSLAAAWCTAENHMGSTCACGSRPTV